MNNCIARWSRLLRGRTYSGERRSVLNTFFTCCSVSTSQSHRHITTSAAHPNRHCSALPQPQPQLGGAVITSVTLPGMTGAVTNSYGPSKKVHKQLWPDGREYRFAYTLSGACVYHISAPLTRVLGPDAPKVDSAANAAAGWRFSGGLVVEAKVFDNQDQLLQSQKFNGDRLATQATDAQGQGIQYGRDAANRITSITDPLGRITRKFYDQQGNLTKTIDPAGRVSETVYATINNIVKPVAMTRSKEVGVQSSSMTYDSLRANLLTATNPIGQTTSFGYDSSNTFMTSVASPLGHITRFQHNSAGDVTRITDPLNNETNFTRDAVGRLTSVTDPQGHSSQYQYNALNQLTQGTDAIGGATKLAYDGGNRQIGRAHV